MDRVDGSCAVNDMHVLVVELLHVTIVPKTTLVTETFIFLFNFFSLTTFTRASNQLTATTSRKIDGFGSYFSFLGLAVRSVLTFTVTVDVRSVCPAIQCEFFFEISLTNQVPRGTCPR